MSDDSRTLQAPWLDLLLLHIEDHATDLRMGVFSCAKRTLRMVETDGDIPSPSITTGRKGNLILRWTFENGREFILDFFNYLEFRYRYIGFGSDTGTVIVSKDYADSIRKAFRQAFGVNGVGWSRMMDTLHGMRVE
jgi:hypothetical protein